MKKPLILLADDDLLQLLLASQVFHEAGYEVVEARTGAEALAALADRPAVRAVFTDIHMPGSPDGLVVARHVRDACPDCVVIVASGQATPSTEDIAAGMRFVPKPYSVYAVVDSFNKLLGSGTPPGPASGS